MKVEAEKIDFDRKPEGVDGNGRPVTVLVVDDELIVRKLLSRVLRSAGYQVVGEAENGEVALEKFRHLRPQIVTLDIEMPVLDGFAALEKIRQEDPAAIVVMLTNDVDRDSVTRILAAGARSYIVKPINRDVILSKLRKVRGVTA